MHDFENKINILLQKIYKEKRNTDLASEMILNSLKGFTGNRGRAWADFSEKDSFLITYGDSITEEGRTPLQTLNAFLKEYVGESFSSLHILPMFPFSSDDGFSIIDYREINPDLGKWEDIENLSLDYDLMFDAVINHISKDSKWFSGFLHGEKPYSEYFHAVDPNADLCSVVRPRELPLLTSFDTATGTKHLWTTFSDDQIDLNYGSVDLLVEILEILILYCRRGARYIRLDAVGFLWKEVGTSCFHLDETHDLVRLMRLVLDACGEGTRIITETNVPHKDNISYFGNGSDEAHMVYQFALPPLVMHAMLSSDTTELMEWLKSLDYISDEVAFFNFLSSHDGIGLRATEGILSKSQRQRLVESAIERGGQVSFRENGDGTKSVYELNINYFDALADRYDSDKTRFNKLIGAVTLLLSLKGVPAIYIHTLLGTRNDYAGLWETGLKRRINREKLNLPLLRELLDDPDAMNFKILKAIKNRLEIRKEHKAFSPLSAQKILFYDSRLFSILREDNKTGEKIRIIINFSKECIIIRDQELRGRDLLNGGIIQNEIFIKGYDSFWILTQ